MAEKNEAAVEGEVEETIDDKMAWLRARGVTIEIPSERQAKSGSKSDDVAKVCTRTLDATPCQPSPHYCDLLLLAAGRNPHLCLCADPRGYLRAI